MPRPVLAVLTAVAAALSVAVMLPTGANADKPPCVGDRHETCPPTATATVTVTSTASPAPTVTTTSTPSPGVPSPTVTVTVPVPGPTVTLPPVFVPTGFNVIVGTPGRDRLKGTSGRDAIFGLGSNDVLFGNAGRDRLYGGRGNDRLWGLDSSRDILRGGLGGNDTCIGRVNDQFRNCENIVIR